MIQMPSEMKIDWLLIWMKFGWMDILFVIVFAMGVFVGFKKGLGGVLPRVIALLFSHMVSIEYNQPFAAFLQSKIPFPIAVWEVLIYLTLVIGGFILVEICFLLLSAVLTFQFKNPVSSVGGAILGGAGAILFFGFVVLFLLFFPFPSLREGIQSKSLSGPLLVQVGPKVHGLFAPFIPQSWRALKS